eukprot:CAMPEP_0182446340 /NCGR_PEP_ID=MMETSP1172-20130603/4138_1 /TAXON_ID=708627 /ORGANISM="Timspurckia oligopyrenoides, Strain CCMP3278" /LENGTH=359 /DNA_ID=CAMNT_0024642255 /DNA_START=147 /DNA_END=1226 /DNA_ORIENTATION=+
MNTTPSRLPHASQPQQLSSSSPSPSSHIFELTNYPIPFPATKLLWIPDPPSLQPDLLASSGDILRIFEVSSTKNDSYQQQHSNDNTKNSNLKLISTLIPHKSTANAHHNASPPDPIYAAPLTSMDWSDSDVSLIITASVTSTCTLWDIHSESIKRQINTNTQTGGGGEREVFDVGFGRGSDQIVTVSGNGTAQLFDLRDNNSSMIYKSEKGLPLLRVAWNKQDPNYLAVLEMSSNGIMLIDLRVPLYPLAELVQRAPRLSVDRRQRVLLRDPVNAFQWAPHSPRHLISGGELGVSYVWDISSVVGDGGNATRIQQQQQSGVDPVLACDIGQRVNNIAWSPADPNWTAVTAANQVQVIKI